MFRIQMKLVCFSFLSLLALLTNSPLSDENDQLYINQKGKKANRKPEKVNGTTGNGPAVKEEVDEDVRTEIMANKMKYKKNKLSERGLKKKEQKKAEKDKKMKKVLVTAGKALKNSLLKQEKADPDQKPDTKPGTKLPFKPVYNSDGKLVFSKFDFAAGTTSLVKNKKSKKFSERSERLPSLPHSILFRGQQECRGCAGRAEEEGQGDQEPDAERRKGKGVGDQERLGLAEGLRQGGGAQGEGRRGAAEEDHSQEGGEEAQVEGELGRSEEEGGPATREPVQEASG